MILGALSPIIVMGVSGVGKTTVAIELAEHLGRTFLDADSMHSQDNVNKMSSGIPLEDKDRWEWLDAVGAAAKAPVPSVVIACSALKLTYRDRIRHSAPGAFFLLLQADSLSMSSRVSNRTEHFMPPSLLASQLATLEILRPNEYGVIVKADGTPSDVLSLVLKTLRA